MDNQRSSLGKVAVAIIAILIGTSLLSVNWYFVQRDYERERRADFDNDNAKYWFSKYGIDIKLEVEQGVDVKFASACLNATTYISTKLFGYSFTGVNVSAIQDDGVSAYAYKDIKPYLLEVDNKSMRMGAQETGRIELGVRFLSGYSDTFILGVSNWGPRIVFLLNRTPDYWTTVHVMLHEFGHSCGLVHNPESAMMNATVEAGYADAHLQSRRYESRTPVVLEKFLQYPTNYSVFPLRRMGHYEVATRQEMQSPSDPLKINYVITATQNRSWYFDSVKSVWIGLDVTNGSMLNLTDPARPTTYFVKIDERTLGLDDYWPLWTRAEILQMMGIYSG